MTDTQPPADADAVETGAARRRGPDAARTSARGAAAQASAGREAVDELPWVEDRVSKLWVLLIVGIFGAILLYGLLFGRAGMLTPVPSPSPSPSPSQLVTPSPAVSTPAASPTPRLSPSPGTPPAGSPTPAGSPPASPSPAAS